MSKCRCGHSLQFHTDKGCSSRFYDMKECQCGPISQSEVKNDRLSQYRLNTTNRIDDIGYLRVRV